MPVLRETTEPRPARKPGEPHGAALSDASTSEPEAIDMNRELERAAVLGFGLGLVLGSLAMWWTDARTAMSGAASGALLVAMTIRPPRAAATEIAPKVPAPPAGSGFPEMTAALRGSD